METQLSTIQTKIQNLFKETTPKECIKLRKGAGGKMFPYVPIDYTLGKLDATFGIFWEFKIIEKQIGKKQVIVQGELNIKSPSGFSVSRPGIGRKNIVFYTGTENPVDIGNDVKAAVSDAIKKAASMFGIAADVYYKELEKYEDIQDDIDQTREERQQSYARFFAVASERGFDGEAAKNRIKEVFKVDHMDKLTVAQIINSTSSLEKFYEKVEAGEKPRKIGEAPKIIRSEPSINTEQEAVKAESVKVDVVEASVDVSEKEDGKPVPYFCQGKKHKETGEKVETTIDAPWCSEECKNTYWNALKKNSKYEEFIQSQKQVKEAVIAT